MRASICSPLPVAQFTAYKGCPYSASWNNKQRADPSVHFSTFPSVSPENRADAGRAVWLAPVRIRLTCQIHTGLLLLRGWGKADACTHARTYKVSPGMRQRASMCKVSVSDQSWPMITCQKSPPYVRCSPPCAVTCNYVTCGGRDEKKSNSPPFCAQVTDGKVDRERERERQSKQYFSYLCTYVGMPLLRPWGRRVPICMLQWGSSNRVTYDNLVACAVGAPRPCWPSCRCPLAYNAEEWLPYVQGTKKQSGLVLSMFSGESSQTHNLSSMLPTNSLRL